MLIVFGTSLPQAMAPCDDIGGTVKRLATKACLQRPTDNEILNATDIYIYIYKLPPV